jgi:tRNA (guanine37-N1)-methyltransferase
LREQYLPYKNLVATVLLDKNPAIRTVINKIDSVGNESEYRTFAYEVLAGPDDLDVTIREQDCTFKFNYAKVYWNSRLHTEHQRLVEQFKEGEAVCDVMAGIGPFAVPAGKRKVFVWANDLNPESFAALKDSIKRNKVDQFVQPFNQDGHAFIREATATLYRTHHTVNIPAKQSRTAKTDPSSQPPPPPPTPQILTQPRTFSHFVMNLPASGITFLPSFIGVYTAGGLPSDTPLPKIHVYCFNTKSDDNKAEKLKICEEISRQLKFDFCPGDGETEGEVAIYDVRDVAPKKRMFCATFRLPRAIAFQEIA